MTIPEIARAEGLSIPNVAKLMRLLRMGGMVQSERGQSGGYTLARTPDEIAVSEVLDLLGGRFFSAKFCERHAGQQDVCAHTVDCSLRVLWNTVQSVLREVLGKTTLRDLLCSENQMADWLSARGTLLLPVLVGKSSKTQPLVE